MTTQPTAREIYALLRRLPSSWLYRRDPLAVCKLHTWQECRGWRYCHVCGWTEIIGMKVLHGI